MIKQMGDSLLLSKHSIQLSDLTPCQNEINETLFKLPWCGIVGSSFVHNVRCNGWDVLYSSQIHTLCVLARLHTESSHRAVFHSLDLTGLLHIDRQVRHGRYPVVKVSILGVHSLLGDLHVCSCRLGILVVNLCYFAVFVDFLL